MQSDMSVTERGSLARLSLSSRPGQHSDRVAVHFAHLAPVEVIPLPHASSRRVLAHPSLASWNAGVSHTATSRPSGLKRRAVISAHGSVRPWWIAFECQSSAVGVRSPTRQTSVGIG
jgi:hypothetical protein